MVQRQTKTSEDIEESMVVKILKLAMAQIRVLFLGIGDVQWLPTSS